MCDLTLMHWVEVSAALLTPVIACLGVWIAYRQMATARATLREKLFDRRMKIFSSVQDFLSSILRTAQVLDETLADFNSARLQSKFLFGEDVPEYLNEIWDRSFKLRKYSLAINDVQRKDERKKFIELESEELKWLTDQLNEVFTKFQPYLTFTK